MRTTNRGTMALAGAMMVGCVGTVATPPVVVAPPPDDPEVVALYESASDVFARHDASGEWDGEACRETLGAFERVNEQMRGRSAHAWTMSGLTASRCGNEDGARDFYERALRVDAELCEPRVALGIQELEAGHTEDAREHFRGAVRGDGHCISGYVNLAIIQRRSEPERNEALANLRRALAVRADYLPALDQMALLYLDGAEETPRMLDLAEMVCRQTQLTAPDHAPLYNTWALIDLARGDLTGAAAKLQRAIELDPDLFAAQMNFGQLTLGQRAYTDARAAFAAARRLQPNSYEAALGEGVASRGLSHPEEAERLYIAARDLDERRPEAWFDLAVLYHEHREGTADQLVQADRFLAEFVSRARGETRFQDTMDEVLRWCDAAAGRRRAPTCRQGRAQTIHQSLVLLGHRTEADRPDWTRR